MLILGVWYMDSKVRSELGNLKDPFALASLLLGPGH